MPVSVTFFLVFFGEAKPLSSTLHKESDFLKDQTGVKVSGLSSAIYIVRIFPLNEHYRRVAFPGHTFSYIFELAMRIAWASDFPPLSAAFAIRAHFLRLAGVLAFLVLPGASEAFQGISGLPRRLGTGVGQSPVAKVPHEAGERCKLAAGGNISYGLSHVNFADHPQRQLYSKVVKTAALG